MIGTSGIIAAFLVACAASIGQIVLKMGMATSVKGTGVDAIIDLLMRPMLWFGLGIYGACALVWLWILAREPVSVAYPILSFSFVLVPLFAVFALKESISVVQWIGLAAIIGGVMLVQVGRV